MRKVFAVHCPKEEDKRYFSKALHKYKNNITVKFNDDVLFDKIDDAEEYTMEEFHESMLNDHTDNREYDSDEENERRYPGHPGQGVQCAQS